MSIVEGITFRDAIDNNKEKIMLYLSLNGKKHTRDIHDHYAGEKEMSAVRKALNELRQEGKIETDDKVGMWRGKRWWITPDKFPDMRFRAFNTHDKEMYGNEVALQLMYKDSIGEKYDRNKWKILQCTGTQDQDKKDLYAGDIVEYNHSTSEYDFEKWLGEIFYDNEYRYGWAIRPIGINKSDEDIGWEVIKIVGNKYENPELLKAKKKRK